MLVATCSNQLGQVKDGLSFGSTPLGANQFGRSQPARVPKTAPCSFSRKYSGEHLMLRTVECSSTGHFMA